MKAKHLFLSLLFLSLAASAMGRPLPEEEPGTEMTNPGSKKPSTIQKNFEDFIGDDEPEKPMANHKTSYYKPSSDKTRSAMTKPGSQKPSTVHKIFNFLGDDEPEEPMANHKTSYDKPSSDKTRSEMTKPGSQKPSTVHKIFNFFGDDEPEEPMADHNTSKYNEIIVLMDKANKLHADLKTLSRSLKLQHLSKSLEQNSVKAFKSLKEVARELEDISGDLKGSDDEGQQPQPTITNAKQKLARADIDPYFGSDNEAKDNWVDEMNTYIQFTSESESDPKSTEDHRPQFARELEDISKDLESSSEDEPEPKSKHQKLDTKMKGPDRADIMWSHDGGNDQWIEEINSKFLLETSTEDHRPQFARELEDISKDLESSEDEPKPKSKHQKLDTKMKGPDRADIVSGFSNKSSNTTSDLYLAVKICASIYLITSIFIIIAYGIICVPQW